MSEIFPELSNVIWQRPEAPLTGCSLLSRWLTAKRGERIGRRGGKHPAQHATSLFSGACNLPRCIPPPPSAPDVTWIARPRLLSARLRQQRVCGLKRKRRETVQKREWWEEMKWGRTQGGLRNLLWWPHEETEQSKMDRMKIQSSAAPFSPKMMDSNNK